MKTHNPWVPVRLPVGNLFWQEHILYLTDKAYIRLQNSRRGTRYRLTLYDANAIQTACRHVKVWTKTFKTKYKRELAKAKLKALEIVYDDTLPAHTWLECTGATNPDYWSELCQAAKNAYTIEKTVYDDERNRWIGV